MNRRLLLALVLVGVAILAAIGYVIVQALMPYKTPIGWVALVVLGLVGAGGMYFVAMLAKLKLDGAMADRDMKRLKVAAATLELKYVRPNEHGYVQAVYDHARDYYMPMIEASPARAALPAAAPAPVVEEPAVEIPRAPAFREMSHLITSERLILCYTSEGAAPGTIDDLLSMAVTGKPGRGKTTALMYYVTMLLKAGAEVFVWDPHGAMSDLAVLNGRRLRGLPASAKVVYLDRKDDIVNSVPVLLAKLDERDNLYRNGRQILHPLMILADELPVLADYDEEVETRYKAINKRLRASGEEEKQVPSLITVIRRFVLEARKWRCFFIGSGQSFDAEILPTRVTENFNSRIVFFSSDKRARMSGLENDAIKNLLPIVRRAGSGVMVFDCSRWDGPVVGAIPNITVEDMLAYLGVTGTGRELVGNPEFERRAMPDLPMKDYSLYGAETVIDAPKFALGRRDTGSLETPVNSLLSDAGNTPDEFPVYPSGPDLGPDDLEMSEIQIQQFKVLYPALGNIVECLKKIDNGRGQGLGKRYHKHASWIVKNEIKQTSNR